MAILTPNADVLISTAPTTIVPSGPIWSTLSDVNTNTYISLGTVGWNDTTFNLGFTKLLPKTTTWTITCTAKIPTGYEVYVDDSYIYLNLVTSDGYTRRVLLNGFDFLTEEWQTFTYTFKDINTYSSTPVDTLYISGTGIDIATLSLTDVTPVDSIVTCYPASDNPEEYSLPTTVVPTGDVWSTIDDVTPDGDSSYIAGKSVDWDCTLDKPIGDNSTWTVTATVKKIGNPVNRTIYFYLFSKLGLVYGAEIDGNILTNDWQTISVPMENYDESYFSPTYYPKNSIEISWSNYVIGANFALSAVSVANGEAEIVPVVSAGLNQELHQVLPSTIFTLTGNIFPEGIFTDYLWTVTSGTAIILNETTLTPQVVMNDIGVVIIRLTATNETESGYGEVTLTVTAWSGIPEWTFTGKLALDLNYHPRHLNGQTPKQFNSKEYC